MGEFYALACALIWALAVIFIRQSGLTIPPLSLNLFRVSISSILLILTMAALGKPLVGSATWQDVLILMASGVLAIAIADTLFHMCLNLVGAGINAIIDTLYSPFIVFFAFLLLGERLTPWQLGGMALVISGVVLSSRAKVSRNGRDRVSLLGVGYGVLSMVALALGIVMAKPVLERTDVVWATTVRQLGALVVLLPAALIRPGPRAVARLFRPQASWRFSLPATVLGSYFALMLWIAGMKYTTAGKAAILNQSSTIFILIFATLFLKEAFTRRKMAAAGLALGGIVLVILG